MKIVEKYPPNYGSIALNMEIVGQPCFAYGETIYNPFKRQIDPDVEMHESIHANQQGDDPETWWHKYAVDKNFRLEQEIEAYAYQYKFVKKHLGDKVGKECLDGLADDLASHIYNFNLTKQQAKTAIYQFAKDINPYMV